ncbi:hypothetical protein [Pseudomonas fluorescens]|uniref:hypothetical protein n=1 Tax=Pseudomonas fluorescens TaxID=294 RepID=UPI00123EFFC8|nr:hypothetical protein [Pseudomonas fluorescens]
MFRSAADAELADDGGEYSEEFAQKFLAIEANETFVEIDCDAHLAFLNRLIEQAGAEEEKSAKLH